jgi:hypothetical protein
MDTVVREIGMGKQGTGAAGSEQRRAHRRRALKRAQVVLSDWTMIDCTIRDVNEEGARLDFGGATSLPEEFRLLSTATATIRPARRSWQRGLSAGIVFTGPERPAPARRA